MPGPGAHRAPWNTLAKAGVLLLSLGATACPQQRARVEAGGTAEDLRDIAAKRGVVFEPRDCATVDGKRVVMCTADLSARDLEALTRALGLAPHGTVPAPGPAFGRSRCFDRMDGGPPHVALITAFPWMTQSHYRYLLIVVPEGGGTACVETEHGYG